MSDWKAKLVDYSAGNEHLHQCAAYSEGQLCCLDKPVIVNFIETEIIEKLIEEIPDRPHLGSEGLKQHLRAKWLGKETV